MYRWTIEYYEREPSGRLYARLIPTGGPIKPTYELKAEQLDAFLLSLVAIIHEPVMERFEEVRKEWIYENPEKARAKIRRELEENPEGTKKWLKEHPDEAEFLMDESP